MAQIKATFSENKHTKNNVTIDVRNLRYYRALELPVLIVRYIHESSELLFKWEHTIPLWEASEDQKTKTISFCDDMDFSDYSPQGIRKTVTALKRLKSTYEDKRISLVFNFSNFFGEYKISRTTREIKQSLPKSALFQLNQHNSDFDITVEIDGDRLTFHIDSLWPTTIALDCEDECSIVSDFLYGFCAFLIRSNFNNHAGILADHMLMNEYRTKNRYLAFLASTAFQATISRSLDMAMLNQIHHDIDTFWVAFYHFILSQDTPQINKSDVVLRLNEAAIEKLSGQIPDYTLSQFYYNIGNHLRFTGSHKKAVSAFNRARKLNPAYMRKEYFLQETGATLFLSGRYSLAARFYDMLLQRGETDERLYFLADALLFCGSFSESRRLFKKISAEEPSIFSFEVWLKIELLDFLTEQCGINQFRRNRGEAKRRLSGIAESMDSFAAALVYKEILEYIDLLEPLASFNNAINLSKKGKTVEALFGFLIASFNNLQDAEAWANAFASALSIKGTPSTIILSIAGLGLHHCGNDFDRNWDKLCRENNVSNEMMQACEDIFQGLSSARKTEELGITFRPLPSDESDSSVSAPEQVKNKAVRSDDQE